ncbi:hypothetical protein TWF751_002937 [Orbilia oligospora]|nr:hypothetical protein TWF751_002937 [Orbilia oligospora]KAF3240632.1 hypothetical protein TWF128_011247 [Orbilia oligospora]
MDFCTPWQIPELFRQRKELSAYIAAGPQVGEDLPESPQMRRPQWGGGSRNPNLRPNVSHNSFVSQAELTSALKSFKNDMITTFQEIMQGLLQKLPVQPPSSTSPPRQTRARAGSRRLGHESRETDWNDPNSAGEMSYFRRSALGMEREETSIYAPYMNMSRYHAREMYSSIAYHITELAKMMSEAGAFTPEMVPASIPTWAPVKPRRKRCRRKQNKFQIFQDNEPAGIYDPSSGPGIGSRTKAPAIGRRPLNPIPIGPKGWRHPRNPISRSKYSYKMPIPLNRHKTLQVSQGGLHGPRPIAGTKWDSHIESNLKSVEFNDTAELSICMEKENLAPPPYS